MHVAKLVSGRDKEAAEVRIPAAAPSTKPAGKAGSKVQTPSRRATPTNQWVRGDAGGKFKHLLTRQQTKHWAGNRELKSLFFSPQPFSFFSFFSIQRKSNCEKAFTQLVGKFHSCWQRVLQQSCPYPVASTDTAAWM